MRRPMAGASKGGTMPAQRTRKRGTTPEAVDKERMVHVRLEPELHRKIRLIVAAEDTTLQEWIARTLEAAAAKAWPGIGDGGE